MHGYELCCNTFVLIERLRQVGVMAVGRPRQHSTEHSTICAANRPKYASCSQLRSSPGYAWPSWHAGECYT